jgi:transposase
MAAKVSPPVETVKPLNQRQLKAIDLRCEGHSWDQITKQMDITLRTIQNWRKHPEWEAVMEHRKKEWVKEYELRFTKMLPDVAKRHQQLVHSQSEAIAMRAVDSAHANHVRCVQQQETKSEVEELKEMVRMLCDQLAQQNAK